MKKLMYFMIFFAAFTGCKDEPTAVVMNDPPKVTSITDIQYVTDLRCYQATVPNANNEAIPFYPLVIQTDSVYQSVNSKKWPDCESNGLPIVDFTNRTLIGVAGFYSGGCEPIITYEAVRNDSTKKILFKHKYIQRGTDLTYGWVSTWITIPKFPSNYTVEIEKVYAGARSCREPNYSVRNAGVMNDLYGVFMADTMTAYAVGSGGIILKTINQGVNWTQQASPVTSTLRSVYFTTTQKGFAAGDNGVLLKTTNGGATWTQISTGTNLDLFSITFAYHALTIRDTGFIGGGKLINNSTQGIVLRTTDGGETWYSVTLPNDFPEVRSIDSKEGMVIASGRNIQGGVALNTKVFYARNDSLHWTNSNIGVTSTINSVWIYPSFEGVACIVGENGAIMESSERYFTNWVRKESHTTASLRAVCGFRELFAVGLEGKVIRSSDNGYIWYKEESGITSDLYSAHAYQSGNYFPTLAVGKNGSVLFFWR